VQGDTLKASLQGRSVVLTDEKGGQSTVTIADVHQSNGAIHVIDSVLLSNEVNSRGVFERPKTHGISEYRVSALCLRRATDLERDKPGS
jgi:hypothetical protein